MIPALPLLRSRLSLPMLFCAAIACGSASGAPLRQTAGLPAGGGLDAQRVVSARYPSGSAPTTLMLAPGAPIAPIAPVVPTPPAAPPGGGITDVTFDTTGVGKSQDQVPVTFGQVFAAGALRRDDTLVGKFADGSCIPLQVDVKATHADGSVRHAIISAVLPKVQPEQVRAMALAKGGTDPGAGAASPSALLGSGFRATVTITLDGKRYTASADKLLAQHGNATWLAGPIATEWLLSAPLTTAQGEVHPHLSARFAIRWYGTAHRARVDVTVENDWAYEPEPQNFTYDASITVGGRQVYAARSLTHLHHARWRKVFWWGQEPELHVRHNTRYLIATRALPNYDQSLTIAESTLASLQARWDKAKTEPMGIGLAVPYMPTTGGREDIGLLPSWAADYLLSMDKRAKEVTLGTADLAGSWSAHYRDQSTGRPISLIDHPYMTVLGALSDTFDPIAHKHQAFPACARPGACASPYLHDSSHQPAFAYLPYLVTGDYYYLEELQFWAMWNVFASNPGYREHNKGLLKSDQIRGQAWSLRTLGEAAYITPDDDPLKSHFTRILASNLDWYNRTYSNNPAANALGVLVNGYALGYKDKTGLAPWQDDFFTAAVGHVAELGFTQAEPLLAWKARFPVERMVGKDSCWVLGSIYAMVVRDSATSPIYRSIGQAYKASSDGAVAGADCASPEMARALKLQVGEMVGYSASPAGFPSNMQPALAYAAGVSGKAGKDAWARFMARSVKPDYSKAPQFAIVPR
jgi:hypothetical protein